MRGCKAILLSCEHQVSYVAYPSIAAEHPVWWWLNDVSFFFLNFSELPTFPSGQLPHRYISLSRIPGFLLFPPSYPSIATHQDLTNHRLLEILPCPPITHGGHVQIPSPAWLPMHLHCMCCLQHAVYSSCPPHTSSTALKISHSPLSNFTFIEHLCAR